MLFLRGCVPFDPLKKLATCVCSLVLVVPPIAEDLRAENACHG